MQGSNEFVAENRRRMRDGELYYAFVADLTADRRRIVQDKAVLPPPLPPPHDSPAEDDELLKDFPWVEAPVKMDYGYNGLERFGKNVFVNFGSTWLDTCTITVGDRTLIGPNCSFFSASHPQDPTLRNGTAGPESGKPIVIGADCWLGGNVIILPGVTIGRGSTVGAGSVVTKDVPEYTCVAGNPARIIKRVDVSAPPPEDGGAVVAD
ncbi:unnamed protein product [Parascedosporium putredinis]|uniref:Mannose-1-phosphate guanylyltransferase n=1 Tax=Parascedosporium putredinis TaxID=1442378 RepID=A0A9P1MC24_9PEZI|nr:unnamed protein product [Parascedosporium putredinis]CAI8000795.1 unnamed protein product [Parascedosporium putredinis]